MIALVCCVVRWNRVRIYHPQKIRLPRRTIVLEEDLTIAGLIYLAPVLLGLKINTLVVMRDVCRLMAGSGF